MRLNDIDGPAGKKAKGKGKRDEEDKGQDTAKAERAGSKAVAGGSTVSGTSVESVGDDVDAKKEAGSAAKHDVRSPAPLHSAPFYRLTNTWTGLQASSLWSAAVETQLAPLFESSPAKLAELRQFVEAGHPNGKKDSKRAFVTDVSLFAPPSSKIAC